MNRHVNRRIRLFLAVLVFAFAGLLLRATWLQSVRAESLSSAREHTAPRIRDASCRSRHDLRPGRPRARARRTCDDGLCQPDADREPASGGPCCGTHTRCRRERSVSDPRGPHEGLRLRRAPGGPGPGGRASAPEAAGLRLLSRGAPELPAGIGGRAGARVRRDGRQRAVGSRAPVRQGARGPRRQGDGRQGSERPGHRRPERAAGDPGSRTCT